MTDSVRFPSLSIFVLLFSVLSASGPATPSAAGAEGLALAAPRRTEGLVQPSTEDLHGNVYEAVEIDQTAAEQRFASAQAAVYFPALRRVRWLASTGAVTAPGKTNAAGTSTLREFTDDIERDFPRFRSNAHGPYLLKQPAMMTGNVKPTAETESVPAAPLATVFTDSFESGMTNWTLNNNTLDLYSWGATTCEARTGTRSADALRGGVNSLTCSDAYAPNVTTTMMHKSCEAIQGASQAWLDAYIHLATESNADKLGFYYADASGLGYGYEFTGTAGAWYHLVFNLKQWYRVGDLTTTSCPKLLVQFYSNATTQPGIGARIDDITIGNAAPGFLTVSITATPSSGPVPLTVNFAPTVVGATSAATYRWSFGDAAGTIATTPTASFTYTTAGDYWPRLSIDDTGVRAAANTLIRATSAAACSVTCTATAPATVAAGSSALFQATATATGCSGTPSYAWTFGDGQTSNQQNTSHTYTAAGSYNWTLTSSIAGATCSKSGTITVAGSTRRRAVMPDPGSTPLASGSIGAAGGSVSGGGLTVSVPAGAFSSTSTIALKKATTSRQEGDVSDTFAITGLPSKLLRDVALDIDVSGSSLGAGEKYYIAADAAVYVKSMPSDQADTVKMIPVEATLSGSKARITLPATWAMPKSAAASPSIESFGARPNAYTGDFRVKAEKRATYQTDHFYSLALPSQSSQTNEILNILESHYQKLTTLGFSFDCRNDSSTKQFRSIRVEPVALGTGNDDPLGRHVSGNDPCGTNWLFSSDYLEISTSYPTSDVRLRGAAAHELFHLVQDMYSPGGARANLWLKEASSIWLENTFGYCPDVQNTYNMFPWNGLFNSKNSAAPAFWTSDREARHGYGASYILKYWTDAAGGSNDRFLINIWTQIKNGNSELSAFQSALGSKSLADYWTQFAKDYFGPSPAGDCFPTLASFVVETIADEKALPRTYSFDAYPLAARSWSLDLAKFKADAAQPVTIRSFGLTSGQRIFIYDRKAKAELVTLTADNLKYEIDDLRKFSGTILMAWFVDTNLPASNSNDISSTNLVALSIGDETKLEKQPWSFLLQWSDSGPARIGSAASWTSSGSGVVQAPKGSTVTVETTTGSIFPTIRIRLHGAPGAVVISGSFLVTIKPMSGRKTDENGSYLEFSFTNPRFVLDDGKVAAGPDFRYDIPERDGSKSFLQAYWFDLNVISYDQQGKQTGSVGWITGIGAGMGIDLERYK